VEMTGWAATGSARVAEGRSEGETGEERQTREGKQTVIYLASDMDLLCPAERLLLYPSISPASRRSTALLLLPGRRSTLVATVAAF